MFRSQGGDLFVYAPSLDLQVATVTPGSPDLGRCNATAFTPAFGLLVYRGTKPGDQCTSMWKGGGSGDIEPPHVVTATYATFPWGSCPTLRVDY